MAFSGKEIERNQTRMESRRSNVDAVREEIAALVLSIQSGTVQPGMTMEGDPRTARQYDDYAAQALVDGVSAFEGFVMPRGQKVQKLRLMDDTMMARTSVRQELEVIENRLLQLRNDPRSGFTNMVNQGATSLFGFGEQSTWPDVRRDPLGRVAGFSYQSEHVGQVFVERDGEGQPMRVHKKFRLTAEQAMRKWGDRIPPKVAEAMTPGLKKNAHAEFDFLHVIEPNMAMKAGRIDPSGMPWRACYYSCADKMAFIQGGYWTLRRVVSCFDRGLNEHYGRSPIMRVMPTVRAIQQIMQDRMLAAEYGAKPPLITEDDELDSAIIDLAPFGITHGGMERGQRKIDQLFQQIDAIGAEKIHAELRQSIDRATYRDLFQLNREYKTHIPASRVMEEIAEKGILLAPLARQEDGWFSAMLPAELQLMDDIGLMDDIDPVVRSALREPAMTAAIYDNRLSQMQQASESAAYLRAAETVATVAPFDPEIVVAFKRQYPPQRAIQRIGQINGIPASWEASDEEKQAFDEAEAAKVQQQDLLTAAPLIGQTAKDLAAAAATGA